MVSNGFHGEGLVDVEMRATEAGLPEARVEFTRDQTKSSQAHGAGGVGETWEVQGSECDGAEGEAGNSETPLTSRLQGVIPLAEIYPSEFLELACLYEDALSSAVEARLYKTGYQVSETLLALSLRLGRLHANARDVIEIHACGVRAVTNDMNAFKACVFMEEARLMTLELMGNLANFYRNYCLDFTGKSRSE